MSEEEKKAIEHLNSFLNIPEYVWLKENELLMVNIKIALNLIENQQKELNNLKEIEKSHKEENGKLRIELEQYKLLEANIDKANRIIAENKFDEGLYGLLMQEKEKSKELNEALERSSGRATELTVENSKLKYQLYHKQQMIDELTQNEEQLKIELGKEKEFVMEYFKESYKVLGLEDK